MKVIISQSNSPSFNLAAEEYLFSEFDKDFLFLYVNEPSVILGSNQAVLNEVDLDFCIEHSIRIIRRLSGGGAVFHDHGNLNYSFIQGKTGEPLSARFLDPVVNALRQMDIPVVVGKRKDLWVDGFKISGTASHLSKGREIHHGTLLYDTDIEMLEKALNPERRDLIRKATASVPSPVKNIRHYLQEQKGDSPGPESFFSMFSELITSILDGDHVDSFDEEEILDIEVLQREKYVQRSWNYRL